jgi:hypothetical protein
MKYKIIIPQEEPNKLNLDKLKSKLDNALKNETKESLTEWLNSKRNKQETLEEVAKRTYQKGLQDDIDLSFYDGVRLGANYQSERMYSEEDMRKAFIAGGNSQIEEDDDYGTEYDAYMEEWFEQFKKK